MTEQETEALAIAELKLREAIELLLQPHMHVVVGIREARQAVVDAQNSVNRVLTGERTI